MSNSLELSPLGHTWILDLDGTLVVHNGHKDPEGDRWLDGALEFLASIPEDDLIIIVTSRADGYREVTEQFLAESNVRYNHIIFNAPYGERVILNDVKPSGLVTAVAVGLERDKGLSSFALTINQDL